MHELIYLLYQILRLHFISTFSLIVSSLHLAMVLWLSTPRSVLHVIVERLRHSPRMTQRSLFTWLASSRTRLEWPTSFAKLTVPAQVSVNHQFNISLPSLWWSIYQKFTVIFLIPMIDEPCIELGRTDMFTFNRFNHIVSITFSRLSLLYHSRDQQEGSCWGRHHSRDSSSRRCWSSRLHWNTTRTTSFGQRVGSAFERRMPSSILQELVSSQYILSSP